MAIHLGDINFGLGPDTTRLDKAIRSVEKFGLVVEKAANATGEGARKTEQNLRRQEKAILDSLQAVLKLSARIRTLGGDASAADALAKSFRNLQTEMTNGERKAIHFQRATERFQADLGRLTRETEENAVAQKKMAAETAANARMQNDMANAIRRTLAAQEKQDALLSKDVGRALKNSLAAAAKSERDFARAIDEAVNAINRQAQAAARQDAAMARQEQSMLRADQVLYRYLRDIDLLTGKNRGLAASMAGDVQRAFAQYNQTLSRGVLTTAEMTRASTALQRALMPIGHELDALRRKIPLEGKGGLAGMFKGIGQASVLLTGPLGGVSARIGIISSLLEDGNLKALAFTAGVAAAAASVLLLGKNAVEAARTMQQLQMQFTAVTGSAEEATDALDYVKEVANRTGTQFDVIAGAYARLTAAAAETGLSTENVNRIFESVTAVSARLQMSVEDTNGTLRAFEQMLSKGTVQAEELRGQLGDRLYGAFNIAAEAMGVTTRELGEMMKAGDVVSTEFIPKFVEAMNTMLGIDPSQTVDSITASENRLHNAFLNMNKAMDDAIGFSAAYQNGIEGLTGAIDWLGQNFDTLIKWIAAAVGAMVGLFAPSIIAGAALLAKNVFQIAKAFIAMAFSMDAVGKNPLMWILKLAGKVGGALLGMTAGYAAVEAALNAIEGAQNDVTGAMEGGALSAVDGYIAAQEGLEHQIRSTTEAYRDQVAAMIETARAAYLAIPNLQSNLAAIAAADAQVEHTNQQMAQLGLDTMTPDEAAAQRQRVFEGIAANDPTVTPQAVTGILDQQDTLVALQERLDALDEIMNKPDILEGLPSGGGGGGGTASQIARRTEVISEALDQIDELRLRTEAIAKGPQALADLEEALDIDNQIDEFADKLRQAGVSAADAAPMVAEFTQALIEMKKAEKDAAETVTAMEFWADIIGNAFDTALDGMIGVIFDGEDALESLANTAKAVAKDIFKTMMTLALLNPLKNFLFGPTGANGTFLPTLGGGGGFMSRLFGGGPVTQNHVGGRAGSAGQMRFGPKLRRGESIHILEDGEMVTPEGGNTGMGGGFTYSDNRVFDLRGASAEAVARLEALRERDRREMPSLIRQVIQNMSR